ncbi:site-specific integrase [Clostridia bacterium]|nr:site-specific integrase [Clostridia bacterium]
MARLGKGIYKRSDGRYEWRYHKGRKSDGSLLYGHVYAKTVTEIREKLTLAVANCELEKAQAGTVSSVLKEYLITTRNQLKSSTLSVYERYLEKHIEPLTGDLKIDKLTQTNIQSFANQKINNGLSAQTVQSVIYFLRAGLSEHLPSEAFAVKLPKDNIYEAKALSVDEQHRLEAALEASDEINRIGVTICLYKGIRIGELCSLTWSDVDFDKGSLHIRHTLERIKNNDGNSKTKLMLLPPKSETSTRSILLPKFLIDQLREHKRDFGGDYVISLNGKPVDPRAIQKRFKRLLELAELKDINFHAATRHTFATRVLENGVDIKTLSEILGHSNATFTMNFYAHSIDEHKRKCMETVATATHIDGNS